LVFLFGAASFVWPPLKVLVGGSVTTSAVIAAAGLALIVLPSLLVGHELLILAVAAGAAGIYWFAHRHGNLKGVIDTLKEN
jgi:DNA-binding transcriptional LysR family regulator